MTIDRVRLSRHLLGRVSQSFRRGGRGDALGDRVIACHRAEFSLEIGPAVDAFARNPGIEKIGPVLDLGRGLQALTPQDRSLAGTWIAATTQFTASWLLLIRSSIGSTPQVATGPRQQTGIQEYP